MRNKSSLTLIGFLLFMIGFLSIFLSLVGLKLSFISWISNALGNGIAFLSYIMMIMTGLIIVYISRQSTEE